MKKTNEFRLTLDARSVNEQIAAALQSYIHTITPKKYRSVYTVTDRFCRICRIVF